jgi:hypothetical protein
MFQHNPSQNYEHLLHAVSGSDGMHDLQYAGALAADANWRRGALISINSNGLLRQGLSTLTAMPMFAINDSTDYDVLSDDGNTAGGAASGFVATGGYELKTTEVDLENFTAADYSWNTALIDAGIANAAQIGKVAPVAGNTFPAASNIVGTTSRGVQSDVYGQQVLYFWPEHLPARS